MRVRCLFFQFCFFPILCIAQNVGVNTSNPQQKLHIGGSNSTIRISAFDSLNHESNSSSTVTAPLYVNSDGVLTLEFEPYYASEGTDDFDGLLSTSTILQPTGHQEVVEQLLYTKTVYVPRPSYVHISYSLSFSVARNQKNESISDGLARIIQTYIKVDALSRQYGKVAQCYINESTTGANRVLFNSASAYIQLEEGYHTIKFFGGVGSDSATATTYVHFGLAQDMLLMRLY